MPTRFATAIALAVFLGATAALLTLNRGAERLPVPARAAAQAALRDSTVARQLERHGYDRYRVTRLDSTDARVAFFDGSRIRAVAAVNGAGHVEHVELFDAGAPRYGSRTSDSPWVLGLLALCFLLATLTRPLLSLRTLDVLALLAFGLPIVAGDHQLFALSVLSGYPPLAYLCGRCAWRAVRGPEPAERPSIPLYDGLTARLPRRQAARFLTYAIAAAVLLLGAIAVGSPGAIDVGYASSAGATLLLHGTLPYGHMPTDVVHGDTYPLLNYIAYIPAAAVSPVRDAFDDTSGAVLVALAAALLVAAALRRSGPRIVLAWLCFPPVAIAVAAGTNDLLLAAALAGALTLASRPGRSTLALMAGAWIKLAPLALVPIWLTRTRGRPLLRSASAVCGLSALLCAWLLVLDGPGTPLKMIDAMSFQLGRGTLQSAWELLGLSPLAQVVQAATVAGVVWATLNARRLSAEPARLAAAAAAILAALQLGAANWSYLYVVWLFPAVAFALLAERQQARQADVERSAG
jgi:hypothetical protein